MMHPTTVEKGPTGQVSEVDGQCGSHSPGMDGSSQGNCVLGPKPLSRLNLAYSPDVSRPNLLAVFGCELSLVRLWFLYYTL